MEILTMLSQGFGLAIAPYNIGALLLGLLVGTLVGVIPGISAANGIALLLPLAATLGLPPESGLILFSSVYYASKYSGRYSAILARVPGDVGSVATCEEGYKMALSGKGRLALMLSGIGSCIGMSAGVLAITLVGPWFVAIGHSFGPADYVALISFVFVLVLCLSSTLVLKNLVSLCLGLMMAVVGLDWGTGVFRYTSTLPELFDGIDFIIVVIGVFALSEAFMMMEKAGSSHKPLSYSSVGGGHVAEGWRNRWACLRGACIGLFIGILPGAGTFVANLAAYRLEKRLEPSPDPEKLATIHPGRVIAPEAGSSACALAAFIPLLALGIPGSATTAVVHGALLHLNIDPGPALSVARPQMVWALIGSLYIGNLVLALLHFRCGHLLTKLLFTPVWVVMPMIVVVAFVSVYAVTQSMIGLLIMVVIGLLAYGMRRFGYPLGPLILAYVLGKPFEDNLRLVLAISGGDVGVLVQTSLSKGLWACVIMAILAGIFLQWKKKETVL